MPTSWLPRRDVRFDFDFEKFLAAVHYLAMCRVPELDKYKVCKLLFLADKYHVVRYGRPIIGDRYCPLPHGPVPSRSLDLLNEFIRSEESKREEMTQMGDVLELDKKFQNPRFVAKKKMEADEMEALSKSDIEALDHVIKIFGARGFDELKSLTHAVYAYRRAVEELADMRYEDFFEEDADAIEGALEKMLEDDAIARAFRAK